MLLQAAGFLGLGVLFLAAPGFVSQFLILLALVALAANAVLSFLAFLFVREKRLISTLLTGAVSLGAAALVNAYPHALSASFGVALALWVLLNALIRFAYAYQLKYTHSPGMARYVVEGVLETALAVVLFKEPVGQLATAYRLAGVYFLLLTVTLVGDALREFFKWDIGGEAVKPRLRVSLPLLLTAFLPSRVVDKINEMLETEKVEALHQVNAPEGMEDGPLEVFFHFGKTVAMGFGHVDFCLNGTFYSYGCYDMDSHRFFDLISDGVLAVAPREKYIEYCTEYEKKTMVGFVFYLSEEQVERLEAAIEQIVKTSTPWTPPKNAKNGRLVGGPIDMQERGGLHYYKLRKGPYQKYDTLRTNCVALAEMLVSETGLPLMQTSGIVTPGTYYAYLDRMFARVNSIVVKKNVYTAYESCAPEDVKQAVKELDNLRPIQKVK